MKKNSSKKILVLIVAVLVISIVAIGLLKTTQSSYISISRSTSEEFFLGLNKQLTTIENNIANTTNEDKIIKYHDQVLSIIDDSMNGLPLDPSLIEFKKIMTIFSQVECSKGIDGLGKLEDINANIKKLKKQGKDVEGLNVMRDYAYIHSIADVGYHIDTIRMAIDEYNKN